MKPKVALAMIVAAHDNDGVALQKCLGSVNGYIDGIFIQLNAPKGKKIDPRVRAVAERFADKVYEYEWRRNFVEARNDSFAKVPKDYNWVMWLDEDDYVENPEMIQQSLAVMPEGTKGVYILYDYQKDEYGNVIVSHWTSRVVKNDGTFKWKSSVDDDEVSVHETLNPVRPVASYSNDEWKVVHTADAQHHRDSLLRNVELLEGMYRRQSYKPEGVDPRILFYLGTHYYDAYRFKEAKELFYQYLKVSGWAEERAEAHVYMGKLLLMENKVAGARNAFLMAIGEYLDNPGAYLELAKLEAKQQRWEQAAKWAEKGLNVESKITAMVRYNHEFDLLTQYAQALSNLGGKHLSKALRTAQKALKLRPYDPVAKENRDSIEKLVEYRNSLRATARIIHLLKVEKEEKKILPLLDYLPSTLYDSPIIINTRNEYTPGKVWPRKSIAIYVGQGPLGNWGPDNLDNGGLGGSEEAVIRLSRELTNLGWKVVVFGTPGTQAGEYEGVEWKHYWELNQKDKFDVLISWRQPGFFDLKWKARKKYLWLHDVVDKEELTPERIKNVTKVIYVSKYHSQRPENQNVPQRKKLPSGNGISPAGFSELDGKFRRNPHRCIYMSANERGLRLLYDIWNDVRESVPDATLDVYYGWHSFDAVNRDNPERMAWKASMVLKAKELAGVTERGRIGQDELNKEIFKSGIFAYPCTFPEVNCITAQKAMAGGAVPVTSDFAVLDDIIEFGDKIHLGEDIEEFKEKYKAALIWWLQNPQEQEKVRGPMMEWARSKFDWKNTAKQWDKEFKGEK